MLVGEAAEQRRVAQALRDLADGAVLVGHTEAR
jgi:hypothetical protein